MQPVLIRPEIRRSAKHLWPHAAIEASNDIRTAQRMPGLARFCIKGLVELRRSDLGPLKARPGIGIRIGGIEPADEVEWQAPVRLKAVEGLERRGCDDASEIEYDGSYHGVCCAFWTMKTAS